MPEGRPWGRVESGTLRWKHRYDRLRREGFVHEEAVRLATGKIGTKKMMEGRRARRKWLKDQLKGHPDLSKNELEEAVDDLYDTYDWFDPWSQFYHGEGD